MSGRFHYEVVSSALHDRAHLAELTTSLSSQLWEIGGVGSPATADFSIPYAVVVATGGTEAMILDRWGDRRRGAPAEPSLMIAHRADNSLPAALEAMSAIRQQGGRGRIVMIERLDDVAAAVREHEAALALRSSRLGLVGPPSDWLVGSRPDALLVRDRWGPTLVPVDLPAPSAVSSTETAVALGRRWSDRDTETVVGRSEVDRAAALHGPLHELMSAQRLDAITVRCFDLLSTIETSGCIALAELNTAGSVAGCEGDVPSALGMMLVRNLFGVASWMANPAWIDPQAGEIELAHCTVAPSLVEDLSLDTHFESGIGVGISGRFRHQPVTLLRIGGAELDEIWVADGEIVGSGSSPHLCRTQASVAVAPERASELLDRPLGNHLVMLPGQHAVQVQRWWELFIDR